MLLDHGHVDGELADRNDVGVFGVPTKIVVISFVDIFFTSRFLAGSGALAGVTAEGRVLNSLGHLREEDLDHLVVLGVGLVLEDVVGRALSSLKAGTAQFGECGNHRQLFDLH